MMIASLVSDLVKVHQIVYLFCKPSLINSQDIIVNYIAHLLILDRLSTLYIEMESGISYAKSTPLSNSLQQ